MSIIIDEAKYEDVSTKVLLMSYKKGAFWSLEYCFDMLPVLDKMVEDNYLLEFEAVLSREGIINMLDPHLMVGHNTQKHVDDLLENGINWAEYGGYRIKFYIVLRKGFEKTKNILKEHNVTNGR